MPVMQARLAFVRRSFQNARHEDAGQSAASPASFLEVISMAWEIVSGCFPISPFDPNPVGWTITRRETEQQALDHALHLIRRENIGVRSVSEVGAEIPKYETETLIALANARPFQA